MAIVEHQNNINYEIEKDLYVDKYIVWESHLNYKIDRHQGTKKECQEWVKKEMKKNKKVKK